MELYKAKNESKKKKLSKFPRIAWSLLLLRLTPLPAPLPTPFPTQVESHPNVILFCQTSPSS